VTTDPDIAVGCNIDTVVGCRPGKAFAWATPSIDDIPFRIELDDWRGRSTAIADAHFQADLSEAAKHFVLIAVNNEDVITGVDVHTDGAAENPLVGQGFGPERVHFECRSHDSAARSFSSLLEIGVANAERHKSDCKCGSCRILDMSCHSFFPPG